MRNIFIILLLLMGTVCTQAQTEKEESTDFPETMQSDMDSLFWDWQSKNGYTLRIVPQAALANHFRRGF